MCQRRYSSICSCFLISKLSHGPVHRSILVLCITKILGWHFCFPALVAFYGAISYGSSVDFPVVACSLSMVMYSASTTFSLSMLLYNAISSSEDLWFGFASKVSFNSLGEDLIPFTVQKLLALLRCISLIKPKHSFWSATICLAASFFAAWVFLISRRFPCRLLIISS